METTLYYHYILQFFPTLYFKINFYYDGNEKRLLIFCLLFSSLVIQLPGYLAGDWWVESRSLSYILPHRFSVRDESHRLSRSFILGGDPKRHINQISKRTKPILFIYCLFNVITIPNQGPLFFPLSATSPSQVTPSKVPSSVLYSDAS